MGKTYWRDYWGGNCPYCGKYVKPKPIIGMSHFCRMSNEPTSSDYQIKKRLEANHGE